MPLFFEELTPSKMNTAQRQGFFVTLAVALLVLLLHFPFDGYDIEHSVVTRYGTPPCQKPDFEGSLLDMTKEQLDFYKREVIRCAEFNATRQREERQIQIRPFSDWKSKAPIVEWFGSIVHAVVVLVFCTLLGGLWLWLFRTSKNG